MAKDTYRGEDATLELIRKRCEEMQKTTVFESQEHAWDVAVEDVYCDFTAQGLTSSADAALKRQTKDYLKHVHLQTTPINR